ncbi:electron transport complex subunit RsxC [Psychromonas sp. PT13]|uniref:electron transport complex subunit RsxC n=1 Tax=Psychromonas sp. PT13 TaxID=3439547 RepID=UPI003EB7A4A5
MTTKPINLLSQELIDQISSGKQWSFHGGVHPQQNKQQTDQILIEDAGIPPYLIIAVEHKGFIPEILVKVGDPVLKGQALTKVYGAMVVQHASSSGTVRAIEKRADLHPSGLPVLSIVIETDGLDNSIEYKKFDDYTKQSNAVLIETIQNAGIVGLGGAGFPSHLKIMHSENISLLLINGIECEPYITADDRLMQEQSDELLAGIKVLQQILKPQLTVIAVEDNKPQACSVLNDAVNASLQKDIIVTTIPTCYPSGSAKQLIEIITGKQVPQGKHLTELGIVMLNVGTVVAMKEAVIDGKPLLSRIVTMTGDALQKRGNARVRIGTPIQYLLDKYQYINKPKQKLIIGGPMMGFTLTESDIPVTKICNCILAPTRKELPDPPPEMPCIRCSECAEVCPAELLPQQLLWYSKSKDTQKLDEYNLSSCIECGACAFVCPSHIPLVEYYRIAKAEIKNAEQEAKKSEQARIRFENRQARLEQAKIDRQKKLKEAAAQRQQQLKEKNGGEDVVAAAIARAKAKKASEGNSTEETTTTNKSPNTAVAAAIARAKAKKEAAQANNTEQTTAGSTKNPAVAAAVARAKAKKEAAQANNTEQTTAGSTKNPAVAAAVARAKAKKEAAQANNTEQTTAGSTKNPAVAAAVARAKAKKEAAQANKTKETTAGSTKNPAVAAAVARAKAKKEAAQANKPKGTTADNAKNPAVAAAVAKAKAKKAAEQAQKTEDTTAGSTKNPAVATAIARAKAKKAAREAAKKEPVNNQPELNDQSNMIEHDTQDGSNKTENNNKPLPADNKASRIAAAVAKAKAKKLASKD